MKKRISLIIAFLLSVLSVCAAMADTKAPVLPDGDLKVMDVRLKPDQVWEVYTGPGPEYAVANNGKARVNTRDWVQVLGGEDGGRILVQYAISKERMRIGWIDADALNACGGSARPDESQLSLPYGQLGYDRCGNR